ncbi:MAG: ABC transporter permease [Bacteroidota bacterium]
MSKKNNTTPPIFAEKLLKWFAGKADLEDIQGDLDEVYALNREQQGKLRADIAYWKQVLSLLFSYGLKKRKRSASYSSYYHKNSFAMLKNYFKIAFRSFSKHKLFTSLNIIGLALGMSVCLVALSITVAVYSSDEFHEHKDRIHQLNTYIADDIEDKTYVSTFHATGDHIKENFPFIEEVVNIKADFKPVVDHHGNDLDFFGYFAGEAFFDVFSFKMLSGDPQSALQKPYSLVLTEKTAKKLFRDENPIGKTVETNMGDFTVTGVMENLTQTHFYFEMLTSYETLKDLYPIDLKNDWINFRNNYSYALLKEGTSEEELSVALEQTSRHASIFHPEKKIKLESVVLPDVVPRWNVSNIIGIGWDKPTLIFFMAIGFLILLPAVFNHTNLSIARALKRAKEIGIRKVVGAEKFQIKAQFIIETVLMALLALCVSFLFVIPMKEGFLDMVYFSEVLDTDLNIYQTIVFVFFSVLVGLFAGIFPAKYFSRLNPIQTLKGEIMNTKNGVSGFKKGLFVFQFFLSLVFIIGVGAIGKQYSYVLNNNHGFESDNILTVPFKAIDKQVALNELGNHPDVKLISASSSLPGLLTRDRIQATSNQVDSIDVMQVYITDDFVPQMNMELIWGESKAILRSSQNEELVLVNQQFIESLKVFNLQKDTLRFTLDDGTKCRVVGIMKDFNFEPLTEHIDPLLMRHSLEESTYALLTVNSPDIKRTIAELDEIWKGIDQNEGFQASFLEDEIEEAYYFMMAQIKFFSVLSVLAITISCLGLLGMVSYSTENRIKEIAVRKIMGATDGSLYYLLTKDFIKLIGISAMIAIPFSYVFYDRIFLYFLIRYGTGVGALEILVGILFLFIVGAISIYWQTAKVTKSNPATKLRYE